MDDWPRRRSYYQRVRTWRRLLDALGPAADRLALRKGASETSLVAAETLLASRLPADYRAWLAITDGQEPEGLSILPTGGWLLSIDRMLEQWTHERNFDLEDSDALLEAQDDNRARWFVFHPKRITIGGWHFLDGDNTVLDLIPGPAGAVGQLMDFVTECDFQVIGASFDAYLARVAELVEQKQLVVAETENGPALRVPGTDSRWEWLARGQRH
jgi:cell wall assembly regulator SMI1